VHGIRRTRWKMRGHTRRRQAGCSAQWDWRPSVVRKRFTTAFGEYCRRHNILRSLVSCEGNQRDVEPEGRRLCRLQ